MHHMTIVVSALIYLLIYKSLHCRRGSVCLGRGSQLIFNKEDKVEATDFSHHTLFKIYLAIFYVLHFFFHHPSVKLSKFKLQRREQYLRHKTP